MRFVWFWTFWHWSKESFRGGWLLRRPLQGIGSHWDEWFCHEASDSDLQAIEAIGRTGSGQRQFIAWLLRHWARETEWRGNRMVPRFVLGQLAHVPPFDRWPALEKFRVGYGLGGMSAIVLEADSTGEAEDVRQAEALALPADAASKTVAEGFQAEAMELDKSRQAAMSLLSGKGLLFFLGLWILGGHRPYPRWLKIALGIGWLAVGALLLYLLVGPEPGEGLLPLCTTLSGLWCGLVLIAIAVAARQCFRAWRQGERWSSSLEQSQLRLRMNGGLTLKGESAGLPFCLNTLLALYRADPGSARRSWLWRRLFCRLHSEAKSWAATGVVTADGYLKPVVVEPKIRACLQTAGIEHILTPRQRGVSRQIINRLAAALPMAGRKSAPVSSGIAPARLGFAAERPRLLSHRCRHAAQALMALGNFDSGWQKAVSALAASVSCAMLVALPDVWCILRPPPAPDAVAPSSPSPYHLWISLNTKHHERFQVVLESDFWANRRVKVSEQGGAIAPARAEIHLRRLPRPAGNEEDATIWIERRLRFLTREYAQGERVGRYSLPYLARLGRE